MNKLKAIFHVNETASWQKALSNISNFYKDAGKDGLDVEVVANGPSVTVYTGSCQLSQGESCGETTGKLLDQMNELARSGVKFTACRNSLKTFAIEENSLPDFVKVIPAGITEIVMKQSDGYAYIKP